MSASATLQEHHRLVCVDLLRGAVMVIMALDHTRDFFSNAHFDPTDLGQTSVPLFLTRWITHFCAPVFIFLAGAGACLSARFVPSKMHLSRLLIIRGLWILFLGIFAETLIWSVGPDFSLISGAVLWAIGWSMLVLAVLIFFPPYMVAIFGIVMILSHNLFDGISPTELGALGPLWAILHTGDTVQITADLALLPYYPLIPWIGVMAAGYGFGKLLLLDPGVQSRLLTGLGLFMIALFIVLRYGNVYGDPQPWTPQDGVVFTLLSFVNCEKYPPSLLYLLMTLGPAIAVLPWLDRNPGRIGRFLLAFGRVPLFYYLLHLPFIGLLALALAWITGGPIAALLDDPFSTPGYGYGLPVVYLIWAVVVITLYPACRWFGDVKARQRHRGWRRYI